MLLQKCNQDLILESVEVAKRLGDIKESYYNTLTAACLDNGVNINLFNIQLNESIKPDENLVQRMIEGAEITQDVLYRELPSTSQVEMYCCSAYQGAMQKTIKSLY